MGNQKRKSMEIEEEFMVINDKIGENIGLESPLGLSFSEPPILDIQTKGMSQDLH